MQKRIDRWLEHQCLSPNEWQIRPVVNTGQSVAQIWRLSPHAADIDDPFVAIRHEPSGECETSKCNIQLGFAIRNWGYPSRDRKSIQKILFFQKALHIGLLKTTATGISLAGDFRHSSIVPDVMAWSDQSWCLEYASSIWTIETWRPGIPVDPTTVISDALLDQAFDILERLHAIGRQLGIQRVVSPGLVERTKRLDHWSSVDTSSWSQRIDELEARISTILELSVWKDILSRTLDRLREKEGLLRSELQRLVSSPVDCHWIIRDLWRENILVDSEHISGIIDFGAARVDWPFLEIVRWLSSWLAPNDPRIPNMLEAHNMLSMARDYRFLDHLSTMLSLLQWFQWLLFANISFEGRENRVRARVLELDRRLTKFCE